MLIKEILVSEILLKALERELAGRVAMEWPWALMEQKVGRVEFIGDLIYLLLANKEVYSDEVLFGNVVGVKNPEEIRIEIQKNPGGW